MSQIIAEVVSDTNWTLLTVIILILANPFNIGLAFNNDTGNTQAEFFNLQTQKEEQAVRVEGTLRPGESFKGPDGMEAIKLFQKKVKLALLQRLAI